MEEHSRLLANHVRELLDEGTLVWREMQVPYHNMAATLTDAFLQGGISYDRVVSPKIGIIRRRYSEVVTTADFLAVLQRGDEFWAAINWRGPKKRGWIENAAKVLNGAGVQTEEDLLEMVSARPNELRAVPGVGPKTFNYLAALCGAKDQIAIDLQLRRFMRESGIDAGDSMGAAEMEAIYRQAASDLDVSPVVLDHTVWSYMSRSRSAK
ncbi:MAG TPA: hypothetical protein VFH17_01690 [Coriobacteriia bacterium]|nr:hypothetical protein [Coriobacteriia bacterium]